MLGPTYFHIVLQFSLLPFMENEDSFLPYCSNAIENNQDLPHSYEYAIYVYADMTS